MRPRKQLTSRMGKFVENTPFWVISITIVALIFSCSIYFWVANPHNIGTNKHTLSFGDSIYFSIISFSSLGYGDISPKGFGKVIAAFEVLAGLVLVAFFVGKLASERQMALLLLVYTSDQQRRIAEFGYNITELDNSLNDALQNKDHVALNNQSLKNFAFISSVCSYLILHANQGDIAAFGNTSTLRKLYKILFKIQTTSFEAAKIYGVDESARKGYGNLILKLKGTASVLIKFHRDDFNAIKSLNSIVKIGVNFILWEQKRAEGIAVYNGTDFIIEKICSIMPPTPWEKNIHKKIAKELGISNKQTHGFIDLLVKRGQWPELLIKEKTKEEER